MAKLLPIARKTWRLDSPVNIQRRICCVGHLLNARIISNYKEFSTKNSNESSSQSSEDSKSLSKAQSGGEVQTTFTKVKETTKTASYMGVILAGLGVTAIIFYTVLKELFSSKSPNSVYSKALDRCRKDPNVQNALGEPIKGFGEETRRGRRRHVSHVLYNKDGVPHLRMKFYIEGIRKKATVHLEMKENEDGDYVYRYLFVETDDFGRPPIILEDNRYGHVDPPKGKHIGEDPSFMKMLDENEPAIQ